ncbi:hypothetical protein HH212_26930 (plasmid) [Massilia forsythiae]|uniref:Uncharacterized protein n=1 Tax=Massilia forsythiae TaxID=2728020 RepID=A0A7Z2W2X7_9BURK|nr:hypothetical protein [Massilia forsythiae]QJE03734.1 hypothetical protein HH212_26930 [Massilia forsythiae]
MKIVEASNSVLALGAHQYFILQDDAGNEIAQLNGFVIGSDGVPSSTGLVGTLQVRTDYVMNSKDSIAQKVVLEGSDEYIQKVWDAGKLCGVEINNRNYTYNAFDTAGGHNSNAAFTTLAKCMGVAVNDLTPWHTTPGLNDTILDQNVIAYLRAISGFADPNGTTTPGVGSGGEHTGGSAGSMPGGSSGSYTPSPGTGAVGGGYWHPISAHLESPAPYDLPTESQTTPVTIIGVSDITAVA